MFEDAVADKNSMIHKYFLVLDTRDCYTCSFKEFLPFTSAMYYFSCFKAFKSACPIA
jgi:hypothetical protein